MTVTPDASYATVLFVESVHRVSVTPGVGGIRNAGATIVDEYGRTLGRLGTNSWFAARVSPGEHVFVAVEGPKSPVHAWLTAGRVYVIEVKLATFKGLKLEPIGPRHDHWNRVPVWLADFAPRPADLAPEPSAEGTEAVAIARQHLADIPAEEHERLVLHPEDGTDAPVHSR